MLADDPPLAEPARPRRVDVVALQHLEQARAQHPHHDDGLWEELSNSDLEATPTQERVPAALARSIPEGEPEGPIDAVADERTDEDKTDPDYSGPIEEVEPQ